MSVSQHYINQVRHPVLSMRFYKSLQTNRVKLIQGWTPTNKFSLIGTVRDLYLDDLLLYGVFDQLSPVVKIQLLH